jgi:hypothetical protein
MLTYKEYKTLCNEVARLRARGEVLDVSNSFERREMQSVIKQLKQIVGMPTKSSLTLVASCGVLKGEGDPNEAK